MDGVSIEFDENMNFIVGENNLGKSNLLQLLKILFKKSSFSENDFTNKSKPIEIEFSLKLQSFEIGHFSDLFDPQDKDIISIICRQSIEDDYMQFFHKESKVNISRYAIQGINFVYYDSLRNPSSEVTFDRRRGIGKFLNKIISSYLSDQNSDLEHFLNKKEIEPIINEINSKLEKLRIFTRFSIKAEEESSLIDILSKIIVLKDANKQHLDKIGYGVQFFILIILSILEQIDTVMNSKRVKAVFNKEDKDGNKKYISIVIGLDEPEIHLHPHMQRSLVGYMKEIVSNKNGSFTQLIKDLWEIDGFDGQIIIVTHSPNIISDDYHQVIRIYSSEKDHIEVKSGQLVNLSLQSEKHIHLQFPFIKEAFFSRGVIFVEGESEIGALRLFANTMGVNLDEHGISVIKTSGKNSMEPLMKVVEDFGIKGVGIVDRDDEPKESSLDEKPRENNTKLFLTNKRDFEEELVSKLLENGNESKLRSIVKEYDNKEESSIIIQKATINKHLFKNDTPKYSIVSTKVDKDLKLKDCTSDELKYFYLTWFLLRKTRELGRLIGQKLDKDDIPEIYKTVINEAIGINS